MTLSILTLLISIRNASLLQKESVLIPFSKVGCALLKILYKNGIIQNFFTLKGTFFLSERFIVYLRYFFSIPTVRSIKLISKPSLRFFLTFQDLCQLTDTRHTLFLSTVKGILSSFDCKKQQVGGTVLFKC